MLLKPLTEARVSGTGTVQFDAYESGGIFGGALISTDGTNAARVIVRRNNATGMVLFDVGTVTAGLIVAPISSDGTSVLYYDISGTNVSAMLYEWFK